MSKRTTKPSPAVCAKELLLHIAQLGFRGSIVSIQHLPELKADMEGWQSQGMLDKEFVKERLGSFDFRIPEALPKAKSMIVVAVPRPQAQAIFAWQGSKKALILPPTYVAYKQTSRKVQDLLAEFLKTRGYRVAPTALPLKLLAVRSGLGQYGRNNICYVPGMGSFLQLVAVYSDLPCQANNWRKPQMMERCRRCRACMRSCPTGAIPSDRFLLRAERCIVFHNEKKGDILFPAWMDPSWHNCLLGCIHCQRVCPEDREFLQWIVEKEEFSHKETELLLKGVTRDQLPAATVAKLERLDLIEDVDILPRNMGVFFRKGA